MERNRTSGLRAEPSHPRVNCRCELPALNAPALNHPTGQAHEPSATRSEGRPNRPASESHGRLGDNGMASAKGTSRTRSREGGVAGDERGEGALDEPAVPSRSARSQDGCVSGDGASSHPLGIGPTLEHLLTSLGCPSLTTKERFDWLLAPDDGHTG